MDPHTPNQVSTPIYLQEKTPKYEEFASQKYFLQHLFLVFSTSPKRTIFR